MAARMERITPAKCWAQCNEKPTHTVYFGTQRLGDFCESHATEVVATYNGYQEFLDRANAAPTPCVGGGQK